MDAADVTWPDIDWKKVKIVGHTIPILIDTRHIEERRKAGIDIMKHYGDMAMGAFLEFGDAVFWSGDMATSVCVEIKRPLDIASSVETTGRLIEQLRKARTVHQSYVVIEQGDTGCDPRTGNYAVRRLARDDRLGQHRWEWHPVRIPDKRGGHYISYQAIDNYFNSLAILNNVHFKRAIDDYQTARVIIDLYHWWQKDIEAHTATAEDTFYRPNHLPTSSMSLVRRMANQIEGIGIRKSRQVEDVMGSAMAMMNADEKLWMKVPGIGKTMAKRIVNEIRTGNKVGQE